MSLGSFGIVGFTRVRPGGRCVHVGSFGPLVRALVVVGSIRGRLVSLARALGSLGAFVVVGFTRARPEGLWVHAGSFGLLACALVHAGSLGSSGVTFACPGVRRVHRGSLGSLARALWVVGFTGACPGGCCVHPGSFAYAMGVVWVIRGCWVHTRFPWGSLGLLARYLVVVLFPCVCHGGRLVHPVWLGSLSRVLGFVGVVGCTRARPVGLCVRPGSLGSRAHALEWLGSFVLALGIVVFMMGRWVHSRMPWGSLGSSGVIVFKRTRPGGVWCHSLATWW